MNHAKEPGGRSTIVSLEELSSRFELPLEWLTEINKTFPIKVSRHFFNLIKEKGDPLYKQVIPDSAELVECATDPLNEDADSPVSNLVHRYPDRCLLLVAHECASYCRFCTRKRKVGDPMKINIDGVKAGINYIKEHKEIRDVIVSGGDPLLLRLEVLDEILTELDSIEHVEIKRIGSRVPNFMPELVTDKLVDMLERHHPLFMNIHFNHPDEIDADVSEALRKLAKAGIPLGSQTVLLKGVNDDPVVMKELMRKLLKNRVKPYYIYQADEVGGTDHFRTTVETGLDMIKNLRGWTSGLAVPHYVIDAPGGGGKIPLLPEYLQTLNADEAVLKNYQGREFHYAQP